MVLFLTSLCSLGSCDPITKLLHKPKAVEPGSPPRAPPVLNHPSLGSGEVINPRAVNSRVHNAGC